MTQLPTTGRAVFWGISCRDLCAHEQLVHPVTPLLLMPPTPLHVLSPLRTPDAFAPSHSCEAPLFPP